MGLNSGALIKKLDKTCLDALQGAAGLCLSRTNPSVEIEHWLLKLAEVADSDLTRLFRQFEIDPSRLLADLTRAIDGFKTGHARTPALSSTIDDLMRESWLVASIHFAFPSVRSGHILLALLADPKLGRLARDASKELTKVSVESLWDGLPAICRGVGRRRGGRDVPLGRIPFPEWIDPFGRAKSHAVARRLHDQPHPARPRWRD